MQIILICCPTVIEVFPWKENVFWWRQLSCETACSLSGNIPTLYKLTEGVDSVFNMAETDES
jgi:hypothetical protein